MAALFEKKKTDKKQIVKEEKKIKRGKGIVGTLLSIGGIILFVVTNGRFGGPNKA